MKTTPWPRLLFALPALLFAAAPASRAALPEPFVHYTFSDLVSGSIPTNTFTVNSGTGVGTTGVTGDFNLKIQTASAEIYAVSGAEGSGPFASGRALDLGLSSAMNGTAPPVVFNSVQTALSNCAAMTVTGWVCADEALVNGSYIMRDSAWRLYFSAAQRMTLQVYDSANTNIPYNSAANAFAAPVGQWQFFAVSWSGADAQWYAGTETAAPVVSPLVTGAKTMGPPSTLANSLGRFNGNSGAFKGKFADLRIYTTALDAAQVAEVYNEIKPPLPVITGFAPPAIEVGGRVVISGSNFTAAGGAPLVTDVLFDTITTGAGNFTVDSDTQISVPAVPDGIPDAGDIKLLFASG
ncbi:MAG: LamG domain-containing protein, partial [Opitutaceae bacterium]|nr:LamG domain-containing protein [Opitutaceae bacterium]